MRIQIKILIQWIKMWLHKGTVGALDGGNAAMINKEYVVYIFYSVWTSYILNVEAEAAMTAHQTVYPVLLVTIIRREQQRAGWAAAVSCFRLAVRLFSRYPARLRSLLVQHGGAVWGVHVVRTRSSSNSVELGRSGHRTGARQRPRRGHGLHQMCHPVQSEFSSLFSRGSR